MSPLPVDYTSEAAVVWMIPRHHCPPIVREVVLRTPRRVGPVAVLGDVRLAAYSELAPTAPVAAGGGFRRRAWVLVNLIPGAEPPADAVDVLTVAAGQLARMTTRARFPRQSTVERWRAAGGPTGGGVHASH